MPLPIIHVNWLSIITAVVVSFVLSGMWFGAWFGKTWAKLMNYPDDFVPPPGMMKRAFLLQAFGAFLFAYTSSYTMKVWMPTSWGMPLGSPRYMFGLYHAFFMWLGFLVPLQLGKVAWEGRPWRLFLINAGHDFVNMFLISQIIAHG